MKDYKSYRVWKERGRCQNMKIILTKGYLALKNVQFKID